MQCYSATRYLTPITLSYYQRDSMPFDVFAPIIAFAYIIVLWFAWKRPLPSDQLQMLRNADPNTLRRNLERKHSSQSHLQGSSPGQGQGHVRTPSLTSMRRGSSMDPTMSSESPPLAPLSLAALGSCGTPIPIIVAPVIVTTTSGGGGGGGGVGADVKELTPPSSSSSSPEQGPRQDLLIDVLPALSLLNTTIDEATHPSLSSSSSSSTAAMLKDIVSSSEYEDDDDDGDDGNDKSA